MIQRTNIERILEENLPIEINLLSKEISDLHDQLSKLSARRTLLLNIAEVAGVNIEIHAGTGDKGLDIFRSVQASDINSTHAALSH